MMKALIREQRSSSKTWWRIKLLIFVTALLVTASGLQVGAAEQSGKLETVTFGTTTGGSVGFLTDVIKAYRLDEKNGLKLDLKMFHPAKLANAVLYKAVDAGGFPVISAVRANLQGNRIRLFSGLLWANDSVLVPVNSDYKSIEDLKGKKLGIMSRVTGQYTSMAIVSKMRGIDIEKDFQLLIGAPPALVAFMKKKDVDAIMHFDPTVSKLILAKQVRELALVKDMWKKLTGGNLLLVGLAAYEDWIKTHPGTARRLVKTVADGIKYIKTKPKIFDEVREALGIESEEVANLLKKRQPQYYPDKWDMDIIKNVKFMLQKNVELGFLDKLPKEDILIILK